MTEFGVSLAVVGRSEAAKRIDAAGRAYLKTLEQPADAFPPAGIPKEYQWSAPDDALFRERSRAVAKALSSTVADDGQLVWVPPLKSIILEIAQKYGVGYLDMVGDSRSRPLAHIRHESFYECAVRTMSSLIQIGKAHRRDHTSVLHGIRAHCARNGLQLPRGMRPKQVAKSG